MPSIPMRTGSLALLCLVGGATALLADDWPQWGGSDARNMVCREKNLPVTFEAERREIIAGKTKGDLPKNVKWVARLGRYAYGNPTVAGGKVFVGTDDSNLAGGSRPKRSRAGMVQCFDEATGKLLWRLVVPKRTKVPKRAHYGHQHLGVCSSPTVDGDRVYVVSSACEVLCLDTDGLADGNDGPFKDEGKYMVAHGSKPIELGAKDADIVWRYDMIGELGVVPHDAASCSVLVLGDMLYTSTSNGVDAPHKKVVNPEAPSIIVLDKKTGRLVAVDDEKIGHRLWHAQWSPPSAGRVGGRDLIFVGGGDGICYAFEAIDRARKEPIYLKKVWSYDCNPPRYRLRDGKVIPYYDGDKRKKRGNKNDGQYVGPSQIIATPVFHNGRVYVAIGQDPLHGRGKGMLHCIDAAKTGDITKTGKVWSYDEMDRTISTVTVADGLIYAPDVAGRLHCLDADTGKRYWVHETKTETWGSPLVADGKVYLGTKKYLYVFAAGKQAKVLAKIHLGSAIYSTPVAANGVLYVASQRYLWAACRREEGAK